MVGGIVYKARGKFEELVWEKGRSAVDVIVSRGRLKEAISEMTIQGNGVKFRSYDLLLTECIEERAVVEGRRVHAHMIKICYVPPVYLKTRLLVLYCKCDHLSDARRVLDEMPLKNVVSWTAMISAYSQRGLSFEAFTTFSNMIRSGTEPNEFTFTSVLASCSSSNPGFTEGIQTHSLVIRTGFGFHLHVGSSLLDMYAKNGKVIEARRVFDRLHEHDVVSCTAIISGYAQQGLDQDAMYMFHRLVGDGLHPNHVTYTALLTAISGLAASGQGKEVHAHLLRLHLLSYHTILHNSLTDMYSKCGNLSYSRRVFDRIPDRSVISWNSMLVGYCRHGKGREAADLFRLMINENKVPPDNVTLLSLLSAFSHACMEEEGFHFFEELVKGRYGVEPEPEHYGCMVDLLGRSGKLEKALDFIRGMPIEPTPAIWGSLLGASRVHRDGRVGRIAAEKVMEIEPGNAGNYVVLSNLCSVSGRWDEANVVWEGMRRREVVKEPGRSWIELGRRLHVFYAEDRCHPRREEVFSRVKEVAVEVRAAGYVPDSSCVMQDVDEEEKERMLLGHSEKLALVFGMMNSPDRTPLRVMKNIRMCVDCHIFFLFVSKVYGRDITVRDKSRFHYVVDGACSCRDYW